MSQQLLTDLFQAYYDCRKHKRNSKQALAFEINFEENIFKLSEKIQARNYEISPSSIFIIEKPVKREICAAGFGDRIIHHYISQKLSPLFEKLFIYDSYACRKGKGTLLGVKRAQKAMRAVSENYSKKSYILKLDIAGFFMHIDHEILWKKLKSFIEFYFSEKLEEREILLYLCEKIVFHRPQEDSILKSPKESWIGLPKNKSLFCVISGKGLPLGNLTSQIFANLYLHQFDIFMKQELRLKYYGRFVDDFFIFHKEKDFLLKLIPKIQDFLQAKLGLTLHPKKIYLQDISKGFIFLGICIKPYRNYIGTRTKTNFYEHINTISGNETQEELIHLRQSINSYLGFLRYTDSYRLRKKVCKSVSVKQSLLYFGEKYEVAKVKRDEEYYNILKSKIIEENPLF